jgi:N-acetylneuraminic acid mutarotase
MGTPRQEIGGAAIGDVIYVVGGLAGPTPSDAVEAYDTVADRWRPVAPLPAALHHVAVAAVDGRLYAFGGLVADFGAVASVFAYDPGADAWTPRAPLPTARGAAAAAVLAGRVFVAGGLRAGASVDDFAAYDPATDTWTKLPAMSHACDHLGAATVDPLVYAIGGRDGGTLFALGTAFEPATNLWFKEVAPLLTARGGLAVAALGGRLFAFGGEGNPDHPLGVFPQTEMFEPSLNSWFAQPDMPTPRHGIAAVPVGGRIYVIGGATVQGLGTTGVNEVFLPPSGEPLAVRRLVLARRGKRLRVTARLDGVDDDPATVPLRVRVRDDAGDVASVALGTGTLVAQGRGWRPLPGVLPPGTALSLRRRQALVLRFASGTQRPPSSRKGLGVAVELGARLFAGTFR